MKEKDFLIFGGDERQIYTAEFLRKKGIEVKTYGLNDKFESDFSKAISDSDCIILPLPLTVDNIYIKSCKKKVKIEDFLKFCFKNKFVFVGAISESLRQKFEILNIKFYDYYKSDYFVKINSIYTAEGLLQCILNNKNISIYKSEILITGYGNLSKVICKNLLDMGAYVYVAVRSEPQKEEALKAGCRVLDISELGCKIDYDVIINTPNHFLFDESLYKKYNKETLFIDLASSPGGFSFSTSSYDNILIERGLPTKVCPKSAGELIAKTVLNYDFGE